MTTANGRHGADARRPGHGDGRADAVLLDPRGACPRSSSATARRVRLMLLGEKLIAFRDSAGRVGVMDHRCPHRCASLFLGRNEEGGIRCIYHGWKFDVAGNCLDMPSLPPPGFKDKVKAKAYKVVERAGVVWVYMGSRAEAPPLPALRDPRRARGRDQRQLHPARLQLAAGARGRDRHLAFRLPARRPRRSRRRCRRTSRSATPSPTARREYHLADTPWGTQYAGYREAGPGQTYWRFGNFLFPFWTQAPNGEFGSHMHARAWVPLDDEPHDVLLPVVEARRRRR